MEDQAFPEELNEVLEDPNKDDEKNLPADLFVQSSAQEIPVEELKNEAREINALMPSADN